MLRSDPRALVQHRQARDAVDGLGLELDLPATRAELDRVLDDVANRLTERGPIGEHGRAGAGCRNGDLVPGGQRRDGVGDRAGDPL